MYKKEFVDEYFKVLDAAANDAYDAIFEFRNEVIHGRIKLCMGWLQNHMRDFNTLDVGVFGSKCYQNVSSLSRKVQ